ncbi:hypothetical protein Tco_1503170 [Tanacetum coccineum]
MNVSMVSKVLVQLDMHSVGYMVSGYNMVSDSSISSGLLGNESALVCFCDLVGISSVRVKVSVCYMVLENYNSSVLFVYDGASMSISWLGGMHSVRYKISASSIISICRIYSVSLKSSVQYYIIQCTLKSCQVSYRVGPSSDLDIGSCTRAKRSDVCSAQFNLSSATGVTKPKPKSLNNASFAAKKATHKSKSGPALEPGHGKLQKNVKKPVKQEPNKGKQTVKTGAITPADEKAQLDTVPKEAMPEENKENMVNIYVDLDIYFVTGCSPGGRDERGS